MTIYEAVRKVRKERTIKVKTKEEADKIIEAGISAGYAFTSKQVTWGWLVIDEED